MAQVRPHCCADSKPPAAASNAWNKKLTAHNQRLSSQHHQAVAENQQLRQHVSELEDDVAAARTTLRRMIRDGNRAATGTPQAETGGA